MRPLLIAAERRKRQRRAEDRTDGGTGAICIRPSQTALFTALLSAAAVVEAEFPIHPPAAGALFMLWPWHMQTPFQAKSQRFTSQARVIGLSELAGR